MAQLRRDYELFSERQTAIVVVGPEDAPAFQKYWQSHDLPFVGLPDPNHEVADLYGQKTKLLRFGRMPALVLIDKDGHIRFRHYGANMTDIPDNQMLLDRIDALAGEETGAQADS